MRRYGVGAADVAKLAEHDIDGKALLACTDDDLKGIGLLLGPRRKVQAAIRDAYADAY